MIFVPGPDQASPVKSSGGCDGAHDREAVGDGEVVVALVLGGNGHDRPGAVGRDDVVGDVDRHRLTRERVDTVAPGEHPPLFRRDVSFHSLPIGLGRRCPAELGDRVPAVGGRELADEGVFRGEDDVGDAEAGVRGAS